MHMRDWMADECSSGLILSSSSAAEPPMSEFTTRPEIQGTFGVVSSTHWLASQVAMGVLEKGGNAFDAAVAGGFMLQIVEPHLNGPALGRGACRDSVGHYG